MQTNAISSTHNSTAFQLQDSIRTISNVPVPDKGKIFPKVSEVDRANIVPSVQVPEKVDIFSRVSVPNFSEIFPRVIVPDIGDNLPRVPFCDQTRVTSINPTKVDKTGLEEFNLVRYVTSVSISKY